MADVMIDLETLGTKEDSVVVSIGVVIFDLEKKVILEEFYSPIDTKEQIKKGRSIDPDTLKWWMGQSDAAKRVFSEKAQDFKSILQTLSGILDKHRPLTIHGNGATFDVSIMENAYSMYDLKLPWHYTKVNCFRTFRRFIGNNEKVEKTGIAHNALDDARDQVLYMFKHYNPSEKTLRVVQAHQPLIPPLNINIESLPNVVIEQIGLESRSHMETVTNKVISDEGRRLLEEAYSTGAANWALKFEESSRKCYNLVKAFENADKNLTGKEVTAELLYDLMTEVRDSIEAIVG